LLAKSFKDVGLLVAFYSTEIVFKNDYAIRISGCSHSLEKSRKSVIEARDVFYRPDNEHHLSRRPIQNCLMSLP
jgi:hypothetical protein